MTDTTPTEAVSSIGGLEMLSRIPMRLSVEVGATSLTLSELVALKQDAIVELDRQTDDPLDILVNGTLIARGEIVSVDGRYGIRVCEIVGPAQAGPNGSGVRQ
jgi:flagellar motor switch protein FliN/FliY